jgi:cytochrome c553
MRHWMLGLLLLVLMSPVAAATGDAEKGRQSATQICAACHGVDGNSLIPANPSLAGQHPQYIMKQLNNFKSGERKNPVMSGMVANLSDDDMKNLAAYYASQAPRGGSAKDATLVAGGRKVYRGGNTATAVAACAGCHSPNGAGIPAQYPRLAGQPTEYTIAQLKSFRSGDRANDPNNIMRTIAARMTDREIDAVAEYIRGLR